MSEVPLHIETPLCVPTRPPLHPRRLRDLYRVTSFTRHSAPLGPYIRTMPRAQWWSLGGGQFLMSEVPLYCSRQARRWESFREVESPPRERAHARDVERGQAHSTLLKKGDGSANTPVSGERAAPFLRDPRFLTTRTPGPGPRPSPQSLDRQPASGAHPIYGKHASTPPPAIPYREREY